MAIRMLCYAKHRPLPEGAEGERIATSGYALLAMTALFDMLVRTFPEVRIFLLTNMYLLYILSIYSRSGGEHMLILIDNKSGTPIYDQIFTQIKGYILSGELTTDEPLPSIRGLAKDLRISVITTKRAYDELERAGFIYTVPGKGSFAAAKNPELVREEHLKKIEEHMTAIRELAQGAALSRAEVLQMWDLMWEESE